MPAKKKTNAFFDALGGGGAPPRKPTAAPAAKAKGEGTPAAAKAEGQGAPKSEGQGAPAPKPAPTPVRVAKPVTEDDGPKKPGRKRVVPEGWVPVTLMLDPQVRDRLNMISRLKKVTVQETLAEFAEKYVEDHMEFLRSNV